MVELQESHLSPVEWLRDIQSVPGVARARTLDVRMGGSLPDSVRRDAPVLTLPVFGVPPEMLSSLFLTLDRLQAVFPLFRLVIVTDVDLMGVVRGHRWPIEHIMREDSWERLELGRSWRSYVRERFASIVAQYASSGVLTSSLEDGGSSVVSEICRLVGVDHAGLLPAIVESPGDSLSGERHSWRGWLPYTKGESFQMTVAQAGANCRIRGVALASPKIAIVDCSHGAGTSADRLVDDLVAQGWGVFVLAFDESSDLVSRLLAYRALSSAYRSDLATVLFAAPTLAARLRRWEVPYVDLVVEIGGTGEAHRVSKEYANYATLASDWVFSTDLSVSFSLAARAASAMRSLVRA